MYKLVIFDLDGTLMDTSKGVKYSLKDTFKELGEKNISDEIINKFIGPPLVDSFRSLLGYDERKALMGASNFKRNYQNKGASMACIYPNMVETLRELDDSGKILAVATNKTHENAIKILNLFHIDSYFKFIKGNTPGNSYDKADIILECLSKFNVEKKDTILVGDAIQDERAAIKAEVDFLAVTYGFGYTRGQSFDEVKCVKVCNKPYEIIEFVNGKKNND